MDRPVASGRNAERKTRQQEEKTGGEAALERPDIEPGPGAVLRVEQPVDRMPIQHEDHGKRPREIDENDAAFQWVMACSSTLMPTA